MKAAPRPWAAALGLLAALAAACSCGGSDSFAEPQQVRALFAQAEQAAERKDLAVLRRALSPRYADREGRDRRAVEGILRLHLLRNESIHLLTRVAALAVPVPGRAEATVYVAMAGRPIASLEELPALRAALYRFDFVLEKEDGQWRVVQAAWRVAELGDFMHTPLEGDRHSSRSRWSVAPPSGEPVLRSRATQASPPAKPGGEERG